MGRGEERVNLENAWQRCLADIREGNGQQYVMARESSRLEVLVADKNAKDS